MSKQANKTLIGAFVVGSIALLVAAVLILGGGKFFSNKFKVVMFFDGSIKGLNVGSPVMFRGVKVGTVSDINLMLDAKALSFQTPVVAELDPARLVLTGDERDDLARLQALIGHGLKAQLQLQSIVTGQLLVALDLFPDKPARFVRLMKEYPEIPTVPTSLAELSKAIEDLPLKEIIMNLNSAMDGIQKIVNAPEVKEDIQTLHLTLQEARELIRNIDQKIDPLITNLNALTDDARGSLGQATNTLTTLEKDAQEIAITTKQTLESAQSALRKSEKAFATFSDDSQLLYETKKTLKELSAAARSLRILSEYLEQHPEALLRGKPKQEGASQ